jgi:predicted dehydrogenase
MPKNERKTGAPQTGRDKLNVGVVGCGNISDTYFKNCAKFKPLKVTACADVFMEKAREKAKAHGIPNVLTPDELVTSPDVDVVLNLTNPQAHAEICLRAINAGKHVFVEKPFGIIREEGKRIIEAAKAKNVRVGSAPDTFLGGGLQTCRRLLDEGWIGKPVAAAGFMAIHGHEGWHPDPEFTYKRGAGPLFGMGPYYVTALAALLGSVESVSASAKISVPERVITSAPKYGQRIKVEVPTHVTGILQHSSGVTSTLIISYDVWASHLPRIEIYGTEGTLSVPDPNTFGGPVSVFRPEEKEWRQIPVIFKYTENARGLGLTDMVCGILGNRPHRASGELAFHALDIMQSFYDSSDSGEIRKLESRCDRPEPLSSNLLEFDPIP